MADQWPGQDAAPADQWPGQDRTPAQPAQPDPQANPVMPFAIDPQTGMTPQDVDPESLAVAGRAAGKGFMEAGASAVGALAKPSEWFDEAVMGGRGHQRELTQQAQEFIRSKAPEPGAKTPGQEIGAFGAQIAGGFPVGAAEWALGWPMAVLTGLESAEEVAKQRGERPSSWESWRDASLEALERVALGKVVDLPMGRITKGIIFGGGAGIESEVEGRDRESTAVSTVTNFLLGLAGPNITPGSKARLEAAHEAAAAGDGAGGMHHLKEALTDPDVAGPLAKAARERSIEFPEPSGDAAHQAAHQEAGPPRLEGPPDPGIPGPEGGPQLRPPSDPGFRERQERGTEGQLPGPEKQTLLGKPRVDPEMDLSEPMPEKPPEPQHPSGAPGTVYRGSGRADQGAAYNVAGSSVPIAGKGRYFAYDEEGAKEFGPNVEAASTREVVKNPLVITDGEQWRALTREAGWQVPNPFGMGKEETERLTQKLKEVVQSKGHDGVIVHWDHTSPYDIGPKGENFKLLNNVFDKPQVISYNEAAARPAKAPFKPEPRKEPQLDFTKRGERAYGDPAGRVEPALAKEPPRPVQPKRPRGPAAKPLEKHSLFEYIITRGGLRPDPELTHIFGGKNPFIPGFGPLIRKNGMPLDRAREAIVEARYLHDPGDVSGGLSETTVPELLEKIAEEARGRKQYRQGFEPPPDAKADTRDEMQIDHEMRQQLHHELEEIGAGDAIVDDQLWARTREIMDKEGETDIIAAFERAHMEEGHALSEQGHVDPIDDYIPGWHVSDDAGPAPEAGRSLATIPQSTSLARGDRARAISAHDREAAGAAGAIGGGRGGGRLPPPGAEEGEFRDVGGPRRLEGPPPKGTFPDDRLPRMALDDPEATARAKDTIATVMTQRDRVNAMQRQHWDQGEELFRGVPDDARIRMLSNFMHGKDPLMGMAVKKAPPAAKGFTRYAKKGIYVDVPDAEAPTLTRDFLNEALKARGRPLQRGAIGENHSAQIREWFKKSGEIQDIQYQSERLGAEIDYEFRMNYWHLMWKDEAKAQASGAAFHGGRPNFTKHKTFEDPSMGMAAGLELKTTNPAVLAATRQEAGNMAIARVMALKDLVQDGLAATITELSGGRRNAKMPSDVQNWKEVTIGGVRYRVHPEAALMLERSLLSSQKTISEIAGLSPRSGMARGERMLYGALMKARNSTIPLKLAFSAFHALHVLGIDSAQPIAAALHQKLNQRISNAAFLKSLTDHKMLESYAYGAKAAENWPKPFEELSPIQQVEQNLMIAGGYTPGKPSLYEIGATRAFRRQLNDVLPSLKQKLDKDGAGILARVLKSSPEHAKAVGMLIGRGIEAIQGPLFDDWIPAIKTAAYLNQAKLLLTARPELLEGTLESGAALRRELQKVRRSIDNRFGEMQYDKEFMPQLVRKVTMGSMLSVGWNFGFLREFGGGMLVDPASNIYRGAQNLFRDEKLHNEISTRTVYAGIYVGEAMLLTGLMSYLFTGQKPNDIRDLVYPKHADGTRSTTMWFMREFLGTYFHMINEGVGRGAINLAASKLSPVLQSFFQALSNRDYFGHQIYDSNAPVFKQLEQAAAWYAKQVVEPISFSGLEQQGTAQEPSRIAQSFMGFNPAPAYVERSRTVSEIYRAASDLLGGKTAYDEVDRANTMREMAQAFRKAEASHDPKDEENYVALRDKYIEKYPERLGAGGKNLKQSEKNWQRPVALGTFARIGTVSPETQARIFDEAPQSEKAWLQLGLLKRLREGRAFEVTPDMVATFPEADQDNVLKILGPGQRDAYLPYVTPKLQKQYGAPQPAMNPQERAVAQ